MKDLNYHIFFTSPKSLLISFEVKNHNRESILLLQHVKAEIENKLKTQISYITTAFDTILVTFNSDNLNLNGTKTEIEGILKNLPIDSKGENNFKTFEIPLCYKAFGKDLESLSDYTGLKVDEIIKIHSEQIYTLYFIGFMPGFLYMGNVDERIVIPRLKNPRPKVEKGSVGIAENQTGIYPNISPGGWQIIGRTPIDIFDVDKEPPSVFKPGDQIKFKPIDEQTFNSLLNHTNLQLKTL